jgi:hypothetical protein
MPSHQQITSRLLRKNGPPRPCHPISKERKYAQLRLACAQVRLEIDCDFEKKQQLRDAALLQSRLDAWNTQLQNMPVAK